MKKKLLMIILCLFSVFCLVGCGKPRSQVAFEKEMKEFKNPSKKEKGLSAGAAGFESIIKKMTYKINKVEEKDNTATLNVTIHTVNLIEYMPEIALNAGFAGILSFVSPEKADLEMVKYFDELSQREDLSYIDKTLDVKMEKVEGKWLVKNSEELSGSIILGGFSKFFNF